MPPDIAELDFTGLRILQQFFFICVLGLILGLLWTYVVSDMLIDLLNSFTVILKLDKTFMGLVILGKHDIA